MAGTQEFGIGLIGLGIGQQHLLGYQSKGLHVAAICDKDPIRLNQVGEQFGIDKRYTRIVDLIADAEVSVVDIAVQPWIRSPIVKATAEAGKHIPYYLPFPSPIIPEMRFDDLFVEFSPPPRTRRNLHRAVHNLWDVRRQVILPRDIIDINLHNAYVR